MQNDEFQPKLIYLARRSPTLSREAFTPRWREHAALGMSRPRWRNIARYVHCDVLHPTVPANALAEDFDGIGLIWHRSPAARLAHLADTSSRLQMEQDEAATFAEPIVHCCLLAREQCLLAPPGAHTSAVKLTRFWPLALDSAASAQPGGLPSRSNINGLRRAALGHLLNVPLTPERGDSWGLRCAVVEEIWFADVGAALAALPQLTDHAEAANVLTVLTNELELYRI